MIKQSFDIEDYWKVIVFYDVDYSLFNEIEAVFKEYNVSESSISQIYNMMSSAKAKAVTYSSTEHHVSVVLFNLHDSKEDYINSIVHEAEHVKQAMLNAYSVEDEGEAPAYTLGYLIANMYRVFKQLICDYSCT